MTAKTATADNNDMEFRIIEAAKALFVEKGFAETSMSDIATRVGINRPALHYYFRTKDRMFQAVFGMIIQKVLPKLQDIITAKDTPVAERVSRVLDTYYEIFKEKPELPLFIVNEIHRDTEHILNAIYNSPMKPAFTTLIASLREEMADGRLNVVPLPALFYTFYGLMTFPFLTKGLAEHLLEEGKTFDELLELWKPYVIRQMSNLLCARQ